MLIKPGHKRYATPEGVVVEMPPSLRAIYGGFYTEVPDDTPLSYQKCCGETGWGNLYEFPKDRPSDEPGPDAALDEGKKDA